MIHRIPEAAVGQARKDCQPCAAKARRLASSPARSAAAMSDPTLSPDLSATVPLHARVAVIVTPPDVALLDRVLVMGRVAGLWDAETVAALANLRQRLAGEVVEAQRRRAR